jgi:NADPH:quinone reductase-like Zn-dependent oxidoreductase
MSRQVQFDRYGPVDVLHVAEVLRPSAGEGQVLVEVADASPQASDPAILAAMAEHVSWGRLTMPIAAIYPLEQVRAAYTELAAGHGHGKIVLSTVMPADAPPRRR